MNLVKENLIDNPSQETLFKGLYSVKKSLSILTKNSKSRNLAKTIPDLIKELDKIEFVILTMSIIITYHNNMTLQPLISLT